MKQLRLPIFSSKIKIYNLRIVPPEPVFNEVMDFKTQFVDEFGKLPLSKSKPNITIAAFIMNSKYQDLLVKVFNQLGLMEKFNLDITGFGVFEKNSNALHLKVSKTEAIERIHNTVRTLCNDNLVGKLKSLVITNEPHIIISKTNGKKMLYESLEHFQKIGYSKKMEVDHLALVSRSRYKTWENVDQIKLS